MKKMLRPPTRLRLILALVLLLGRGLIAVAQTHIDFAASGLLISTPPTFIRQPVSDHWDKKITLRIKKDPTVAVAPAVDLTRRLITAYGVVFAKTAADNLLLHAGFEVLPEDKRLAIARRYASTIGGLLNDAEIKKNFPNETAAQWLVKGKNAAGAQAPVLFDDSSLVDPKYQFSVLEGESKSGTLSGDWHEATVKIPWQSSFHFEVRRSSPLYLAWQKQQAIPSEGRPNELVDAPLSGLVSALQEIRPFVDHVGKLARNAADIDDANGKELVKLSSRIGRLNDSINDIYLSQLDSVHKANVAEWLLRAMWLSAPGQPYLTATPDFGLATNTLLAQSTLMTSPRRFLNWQRNYLVKMRHHDVAHRLNVLNARDGASLTNAQEMKLLVHNLPEGANAALTNPSVEVVSNDIEVVAREAEALKLIAKGGIYKAVAPIIIKPSLADIQQEVIKLVQAFNKLQQELKPFLNWEQWQNSSPAPDASAAYHTTELTHEAPEAPAIFRYDVAITGAKDQTPLAAVVVRPKIIGADGKAKTDSNGVFGFRYNRLYVFRFKPGFMYSTFLKRKYTLQDNNTQATLTTERYGLAATFGVQVYPWRLDIHSRQFFPRGFPFLYTGLLLTGNVLDNGLIGGGVEVVSGLSLVAGAHWSKTDYLQYNRGVLEIDKNKWRSGTFVQVAVSVEFFERLVNRIASQVQL